MLGASLVRDRIKALVGGSDPPATAVVLDAGTKGDLDSTSTEMLEQLLTSPSPTSANPSAR